LPDGKGGKLCPICDSPLEPGSKKCSFCGTDLAIFETEVEPSRADEKEANDALDDKLEEVFFGPTDDAQAVEAEAKPEPVIAEPEEQLAAEPEPTPEPERVPEPEVRAEVEPSAQEEEVIIESQPETAEAEAPAKEYFECPQCNSNVATTATSCPSCGVMFAEEGADMFQCPACNSLVNIDAKSCPGCGALFVDSEEAAAAGRLSLTDHEPQPVPKPELERPVSDVPVEPESAETAEEIDKEASKKGLFGSIFGKMKKRRQVREEEEPDSILHRREEPRIEPAPIPGQAPAEPEERYEPVAKEPIAHTEVRRELAEETPPVMAAPPAKDKHKAKQLARMTAEMQPLMRLASDNGVDVSESRKLVDEGAMSARARQIDQAFENVTKARDLLMKNLTESVELLMADLKEEVGVAKALGGDVSRTSTYLDALAKANRAGDFEAVYVYAGKVKNELLPITGRYNESKQKLNTLRALVADSEMIDVNTKEARMQIVEATKSFEANDFDAVDAAVRVATKNLYTEIEPRMDDEIRRARNQLVEVKAKGLNITPMITVLKSARTLMKAKDYQQALKEMRDFKEQLGKAL